MKSIVLGLEYRYEGMRYVETSLNFDEVKHFFTFCVELYAPNVVQRHLLTFSCVLLLFIMFYNYRLGLYFVYIVNHCVTSVFF